MQDFLNGIINKKNKKEKNEISNEEEIKSIKELLDEVDIEKKKLVI